MDRVQWGDGIGPQRELVRLLRLAGAAFDAAFERKKSRSDRSPRTSNVYYAKTENGMGVGGPRCFYRYKPLAQSTSDGGPT